MKTEIFQHPFDNGLVLVAEKMAGVQSAAFTLLVPAGVAYDPEGQDGSSALLVDLVFRGAGARDSRTLSAAIDDLGVQRGEGVHAAHSSFSGSTIARNLIPALAIFADVLRRPHLPADQLDAARALAVQELKALDDEPRQKVMVELRARHDPYPWGRCTLGTLESLTTLTIEQVAAQFRRSYHPGGAIFGVAGDIQWEPLLDKVGHLFADWRTQPAPVVTERPPGPKLDHIPQDTTQTQIGIAYRSVPYADPDYFLARAAVGVLSGGMSARLFTELREKRGLCYSVYASYHTLKDRASIVCYAGTTNDRAQETLEVTLGELRRLAEGITNEELDRVKAGLKSSLIMQQESSGSRASAIAGDWYHLGRVRTLDEIHQAIDGLSADAIVEHLRRSPPADFTILTLGPKPLETPRGIS